MKELKKINRLMNFIRSAWKWLPLGIVLMCMIAAVNIAIAQNCKLITDAALHKNWPDFKINLYYLILAALSGFLIKFMQQYAIGRFASDSLTILRSHILKTVLSAKVEVIQTKHTGDILSTFSNDINTIQSFLRDHLARIIYDPLIFVITFLYLFSMNRDMTIVIVIIMPVVLILANFMTKAMGKASHNIQGELGKTNALVADVVKGVEIMKSYNLETRFKEKYINGISKIVKNGIKIDKNTFYIDSVLTVLQLLPYMVFAIYGGYLTANGIMTTGELIAFLNLFDNMYMSLGNIPYTIGDIRVDMASVDRVLNILDLPKERKQKAGMDRVITKSASNAVIEFKNVSFSYDKKEDSLKNISFKVEKGKNIFIIGESGSGKSTIFKLINGFYADYSGNIALFGHEISEWDLEDLRNQIAVVTQDTYLFPGTIKENIRYGNLNAGDSDIIGASKEALAIEFISKLPHGYDTMLDEGGNNLSGGERQRIAIARAILKNAPLLLLDEATSALDGKSEFYVQKALDNLIKGKTVLSITHRLSGIKNSDEIWLVKDGKIIKKDTYKSLMMANKEYDRLYFKYINGETEEGPLC